MSSNGVNAVNMLQKLSAVNESVWMQVGGVAEMMDDLDRAASAYESALRQNPYSIPAMTQIASILRTKEQFSKAVEYLQSILNLDQSNGDIWGSLGHCYLMMDDLQKAYSAYQQALYHLRDPKEPKLWYGIGILYDRYGSLEHAEEAFSQVMRMQPDFDKANEIYFRLGIIYKQQHKYAHSLECFLYILHNPPRPLTEVDIWFQIGHVHEQQKEYKLAREAYDKVLADNPTHAKVLQQLGWLYHQQNSSFSNQDLAITYLTKSLESDGQDAQSWYLLGRCYMAQQKYNKAYEAYQQAVYRDGRNPTFWCSIGVLYYQINQYRDALDAYSRAIRLNPYISEVWYDLGTLYESCNNQVNDALDAYQRAAELDPSNPHIKTRLQLLRSGQAGGPQHANSAPPPQDINPQAYQGPWSRPTNSQSGNPSPPPPAPAPLTSASQTIPPPPPPSARGPSAYAANGRRVGALGTGNGESAAASASRGPLPPPNYPATNVNNVAPGTPGMATAGPALAPIARHASPAQEVKPSLEDTASPPLDRTQSGVAYPSQPSIFPTPNAPTPAITAPTIATVPAPAPGRTEPGATEPGPSAAAGLKRTTREWDQGREEAPKKAATMEKEDEIKKSASPVAAAPEEPKPTARKLDVDENYDEEEPEAQQQPPPSPRSTIDRKLETKVEKELADAKGDPLEASIPGRSRSATPPPTEERAAQAVAGTEESIAVAAAAAEEEAATQATEAAKPKSSEETS